MKKLLLASLLLLLLVSQVSGLALTFQNSGDFASYATCGINKSGSCSWTDNSATCGESYISLIANAYVASERTAAFVKNIDALPSSYAAANIYDGGGFVHQPTVELYASDGSILYTYSDSTTTASNWYRYEMYMVGGQAKIYRDGVLKVTSGVLSQNPSYIGFGGINAYWGGASAYRVDNFVMGDSETGYIFGVPAEGCYLKRDPIGGGSGLYNAAGTLINTYNMTMTWAKKSDGVSATIALQNWGTGVNAESFTTGTSTIFGTKPWAIAEYVTNTYNYGYYVGKTDPTIVGVYSRTVPYQMGGGTASWSSDQYSQNDLATVTVAVPDGPAPSPDYWDTGTYTYSMTVSDLYGNVKQTTTVTSPNQGINYQFSSSDDLGVYVASLYMTRISTGITYLMWQDLTTVNGYIRVEGHAFNSSSEEPLSSVHINITQSSYYQAQYTSATGYYNTSASIPFGTGSVLTINATKPGYRQRYIQFIPQSAKTLNITIPMQPLNVEHTGIMLRGLIVDNVYSNPISTVAVLARNGTENYTVTSNALGEYIFDDTRGGGMLGNATCYQLFAAKNGYTYVSPLTPTCVYGA